LKAEEQTMADYIVRVHQEEDSTYWAEVRDLPGCFASGGSLDQLSEALGESIALYLAPDDQDVELTSEPIRFPPLTVGEMRVSVAA
jgi:predicted RNase H-like HicB family nuclease